MLYFPALKTRQLKGVREDSIYGKQICVLAEDLKGTIEWSVAESTAERIVVVTHHLPTMAVVATEHKSSLLNSVFATELGDFIAGSRIDAWIFGHSHANIDATIGNTRIVCNQLGNVYYRENLGGFDGGKFIEV